MRAAALMNGRHIGCLKELLPPNAGYGHPGGIRKWILGGADASP